MKFRDKFWFLSNMYPTPVKLNLDGKDYTFNNAEAAFQAQKDISRANEFVGLDGATAKKLGRQVNMRPDWNTYRDTAMQNALNAKFSNADLMMMLKNVEGLIQEDNTWNDTYWGVSNGVGQNKLGQILMNIRDINNKKLYTSNYFNSNTNKLDNNYSISVSQPKGFNFPVLENLVPSKDLLNRYKYQGLSWDDYTKEYNGYLDSNTNAIMDTLNSLENNAILNCWEPISNPNCHRHLLAQWARNHGIDMSEYGQPVSKDLGSKELEDVKRFSISFTGHRPKDLDPMFGYDYNSPAWRATIDKTKDGIKYYKPTQVITGMALGYDQAALIAANELRKEGLWNGKIIGDLPFPESGKGKMSNEQWQGYLDMLDEINYLSNGYNNNKQIYQDRNELMVDNSDLVMALYNGADHGGTYNDLVYAKQKGVPAVNIYNNVMKLLGKK